MKKSDRQKLHNKLKTSYELTERGKKVLMSHYTTGHFTDFLFFERGKGAKIYDPDGNEYIDHAMGIGPLILGHCHPVIENAVIETIKKGTVHGIGHEMEIQLAEKLVEAIPCADAVTFTNSGTEATMHAIKCARAYTGKEKIAKFEGHYHGTHDYAQISGRTSTKGPIEDPISVADFGGIPKSVVDNVITLCMGQPESLTKIREHKDELAAVIIEPVPLYFPVDYRDYLRELREVTRESNVLLIFDEVVTGFRLGYGGAQEYFGIIPDLATFGKAIGGGFPVGAIAGPRDIMNTFKFANYDVANRKVYTTGTFSGNPVTCAAGIATIDYLEHNPDVYREMEEKVEYITTEVQKYADQIDFPLQFKSMSSYFVPYFFKDEINTPRDTDWTINLAKYNILRKHMLKNGVNLADVGALYVSVAHTQEDCDRTIEAFKCSLDELL